MMLRSLPAILLISLFSFSAIASDMETSADDVVSYDLSDLLKVLGNALAVHDELPTLEESKFLGRDMEDAQSDIDKLVDEAIGMLGSKTIKELRTQYRKLERKIEQVNSDIVGYKSKRILAPTSGKSMVGSVTPTQTLKRFVASTKGDYDQLIEAAEKDLAAYKSDLASIKDELRQALASIGVTVNTEQLETLMSSVVGDDIISMSVVFRTIKDVTDQLEALSNETSESLEHAKKYYGMVVILYRIVTTMQDTFIARVDEHYLPKLVAYKDEANANIKESRLLMKNGVNVDILKANVQANKLTIEVIELYTKMLKDQKAKVEKARDIASKEGLVADNTYRTVSLSSAVVSMIREGRNTFETLMGIQMPDIRVFKNEDVRSEFQKLTEKMNAS
ncbi:Uncharacterised protein [Zhongshania aliphaticivorans]|uniref:Chromosome partition protein Smc n=2 Tax=Zhongshania aliphaticivorans TaxID=1470434 RepID=A0A5S9NV37_9GAMM|nr:Uncharacterised protein [Zhongshania aliphaticivorans]CAA0094594.1 Uncharacterised protein [Zhongshania aliphaticivorans]